MEQSQKYYTEWKKFWYKRVHAAWFHLCQTPEKINQIYNDRISGCQELGWGLVWRGIRKHSGDSVRAWTLHCESSFRDRHGFQWASWTATNTSSSIRFISQKTYWQNSLCCGLNQLLLLWTPLRGRATLCIPQQQGQRRTSICGMYVLAPKESQ